MEARLLEQLRRRVAGLAIGASSLRNMTGPGGVKIARNFCAAEISLSTLGRDPTSFAAYLDRQTERLASKLPTRKHGGGDPWGPARKNINIFLEDVTYNVHLRNEYKLEGIECLLEVPLDGLVAEGIKRDVEELEISFSPNWRGVINVTPESNAAYQQVALRIASRLGLPARVYLDLRYWRDDPNTTSSSATNQ